VGEEEDILSCGRECVAEVFRATWMHVGIRSDVDAWPGSPAASNLAFVEEKSLGCLHASSSTFSLSIWCFPVEKIATEFVLFISLPF